MPNGVSRRAFLRQAAGAPATGMVADTFRPTARQAWIIVALNWQYNDEYSYPDGTRALPKVYFDRPAAEADCQRICEEFFANQLPLDFEVDFQYFADNLPEDATEESTSWDELRKAGFPDPFHVQEMQI